MDMLTRDQEEQFHRDGFVLGGQVLDDDGVEELRAEMHRVIDARDDETIPQPVMLSNMGKAEAPVWQIVNISDASAPFANLVRHPEIAKTIAALTGAAEVRLWHDQIQFKPASTGGVNMWHQDAPYWPSITPMTQVTAWIALDDVDLDNGCMSMIPGSHLWGNQIAFLHTIKAFDEMPATFNGHDLEVRVCPVKKGHVHFHHALTWHGSSANTSGRPRRAIALHYMGDDTRFVAAGNHLMKKFISVPDGEIITGDRFARVWPL
ncbi:MAG: phytanoyl-CoA dioxygenase family protein [Capsulimonas sp.]|uniref:phytanoyl-CoA dioxygenase family protein n=1 Tax=Capsulimonas sp. TaxID=2494211 RepID=UPI0032673782